MALSVAKEDVWAATIEDKPGGLAVKLEALKAAGANLEFVVARRAPEKGTGVVFVTPLKGAKLLAAAKKAGFKKATSLHGLRVDGPDKAGIGATITAALAEAGVNLRGLSAASIGRKMVCHVAVDDAKTAAKAARVLKKL